MNMQKILKVVKCGECFTVKSEKTETGYLYKRQIVLQELGGRYADQYTASLLGNDALCNFLPALPSAGVQRTDFPGRHRDGNR